MERLHRAAVLVTGVLISLAGSLPAAGQQFVEFETRPQSSPPMRFAGHSSVPGLRAPSQRSHAVAPPARRLAAPTRAERNPENRRRDITFAGIHRALPADPVAQGYWDVLPEGVRVWRWVVESAEARALRVHFSGFQTRGAVWVHDGADSEPAGPYTGAGPNGDGEFWSGIVFGERLIVEYQPAPNETDRIPFLISEISHAFPGAADGLKGSGSGGTNSASCNLDAPCYSEWSQTAAATGMILFETDGYMGGCSGTLLSTSPASQIPYFLTANHCVSDASTARNTIALWLYANRTCRGGDAPRLEDSPQSLGAQLVTTGNTSMGDFTLLRFNSLPNGVAFSGWSADAVPASTQVTAMHHPNLDVTKISFGSTLAGSGSASLDANSFYRVQYTSGVTESGSSGGGLFSKPGVLVGLLSNGPKGDTEEQYCSIRPFVDNYGKFSAIFPKLQAYLTNQSSGGTQTGTELKSGDTARLTLGPVSNSTIFGGGAGYFVTVPEGATKLEIRLTPETANVAAALFVRYGRDVALSNGRPVFDYQISEPANNGLLSITASSSPALKAGVYYLAPAVVTTGAQFRGALSVNITKPSSGSGDGTTLTSGVAKDFSVGPYSQTTLVNGSGSYRITVPEGATGLSIRLQTTVPANADLDLFVRYGQDNEIGSSSVVSDYRSTSTSGNETITITPSSSPALRAGTYYISIAVYTTNVRASGTLTATVATGSNGGAGSGAMLTSGEPRTFTVPAVSQSTLVRLGYQVTVPQGATQLQLRLALTTSNANVDLYARFGEDLALSNGSVVADFRRSGDGVITITPSSSPALKAGVYYIGLGVFTTGINIAGSITATVSTESSGSGGSGGGTSGIALTSGVARSFTIPAASRNTLLNGDAGFQITVPQGATQLKIQLTTTTSNADLDLFVRYGQDVSLSDGHAVCDYSSTSSSGSESVTITASSSPALRAGTYYISLGVFTTGTPINATITATVTTGASGGSGESGGPVDSSVLLSSGVSANLTLPAVSSSTLYGGANIFRIQAPSGATKLEVKLSSSMANADLDLFVRAGTPPTLSNGHVVADFSSSGDTANETITVTPSSTPALTAGVYYIAIASFTTNTAIPATLVATITTAGGSGGSGGSGTGGYTVLTSGVPRTISVPAVDHTALMAGPAGFAIEVPANAASVQIRLTSSPPRWISICMPATARM